MWCKGIYTYAWPQTYSIVVYGCTPERVSIYLDYSGKIFDTDISAVAATHIHWSLPGLRSHVAVTCDHYAGWSCTLPIADNDIFCTRRIPVLWLNSIVASSSALKDRSEWVCWLTRSENSHEDHTAPITIASEALSTTAFLLSLQ